MRHRRPAEPVVIRIDDLAFGGEGVGRHEGQVQFVHGALPGETVRIIPMGGGKRWQRARLLEILEPSSLRISPVCSHTDLCGGCAYQTLAYEAQLDAKARQVRENIARIAGIHPPEVASPLPAPERFHYRNKMEFSFSPRAWDPAGVPDEPVAGPAVGLHARGRFDAILDIHDCALVDSEANRLLATIRDAARSLEIPAYHSRRAEGILRHLVLRSSRFTGEWLLALVAREADPRIHRLAEICRAAHPQIAGFLLWVHPGLATVARAEEEMLLFGRGTIVERLLDLEFELSASSFFQTNSSAAEGLIHELRALAPAGGRVLDLYCGVGTLGLALAGGAEEIVGVESVEAAVLDARRNAARNGIGNSRFIAAPAEDWLSGAREFRPHLVVVDPPRAGLHPRSLAGVTALAAPAILYVSCNPATLARDLAGLTAAGYRADAMRILDMFPHTPHVETIVRLRRG